MTVLRMPSAGFAEPAAMEPYQNLDGDSGVVSYEIGPDFITVQFRSGAPYTYSYASAGVLAVEHMKTLARDGRGLSTYISRYVRDRYERPKSA